MKRGIYVVPQDKICIMEDGKILCQYLKLDSHNNQRMIEWYQKRIDIINDNSAID